MILFVFIVCGNNSCDFFCVLPGRTVDSLFQLFWQRRLPVGTVFAEFLKLKHHGGVGKRLSDIAVFFTRDVEKGLVDLKPLVGENDIAFVVCGNMIFEDVFECRLKQNGLAHYTNFDHTTPFVHFALLLNNS